MAWQCGVTGQTYLYSQIPSHFPSHFSSPRLQLHTVIFLAISRSGEAPGRMTLHPLTMGIRPYAHCQHWEAQDWDRGQGQLYSRLVGYGVPVGVDRVERQI
eukprot:COSAG02_NODE_9369_length_2239_cov_3.166355_1_plen_100_part_10